MSDVENTLKSALTRIEILEAAVRRLSEEINMRALETPHVVHLIDPAYDDNMDPFDDD